MNIYFLYENYFQTSFESYLHSAGEKLVIAYFYASRFGFDKIDQDIIDQFSIQFSDVQFRKIDVDIEANETIPDKHKVPSFPSFVFFKNKKIVDVFCGINDDHLKELIVNNI